MIFVKATIKRILVIPYKRVNLLQKSQKPFLHRSCFNEFSPQFSKFQCGRTGQSHFHRMIATVMKTSFHRLPPKTRHYRDYSNYGKIIFRVSLFNELSKLKKVAIDLNKFVIVCIDTLNNHAPIKKKCITDNHLPFVTKEH